MDTILHKSIYVLGEDLFSKLSYIFMNEVVKR